MQPTTCDKKLPPGSPAKIAQQDSIERAGEGNMGRAELSGASSGLDRCFDRVALRDEVRRALQ
jgi:hypothetical protein